MSKIKLSLICPIFNSFEIVRRQISYLEQLNLPPEVELLFIDDCSTTPLHGSMRNLTIYRTDNKLAWTQGLARNFGAKQAKGDYLFMTDIDHIVSLDAFTDALHFTGNKMIFRRQVAVLDEHGVVRQDKATLQAWGYDKDTLDASVHGNTFVIKKSVFDELGGYDVKRSSIGRHPVSKQGDDCYFNAKWNRAFPGVPLVTGRDIYLFPLGRFHRDGDLNPFGFFHNLSQTTQTSFNK